MSDQISRTLESDLESQSARYRLRNFWHQWSLIALHKKCKFPQNPKVSLLQICRIQLHCYENFLRSLVAIPDKNPKHQIK